MTFRPVYRNYLNSKHVLVVLVFVIFCFQPSVFWAKSDDIYVVGHFSSSTSDNKLPAGWEPLAFKKIKRHTSYSLVKDNGVTVIKAESIAGASGLIRKIKIAPRKYPVVTWQWKVANILNKGDVNKKSGDDYPARLYITFAYDPAGLSFTERLKYRAAKFFYGKYPPMGAIAYIWGSNAPKGTMVPNAYTDRAIMIVVESGKAKLNTWIAEKRNIVEDYKKAFGKNPPLISGVAIMTDTDNTKESATAYYGDILFKKKGSMLRKYQKAPGAENQRP